jgi:chemotaxis protein CheD
MLERITIHIGEYYGSAEPAEIRTLVGSCVAVCLFDPIRNVGGMNHIFLPGRADLNHYDAPARFGINAMELLINRMLVLGADRRRLTAKAFGGAHMLPGIPMEKNPGWKISEFVMSFLETESIPLVSCNLGGREGRQIYFHTHTGDAYVKHIKPSQITEVWSEEEMAAINLRRKIKKTGEIVLFKNS